MKLKYTTSFLFCVISFLQINAQPHYFAGTVGLKFGTCSSDAMYYSTQNYVNIFDNTRSGTTGVKDVYSDKFGYWGWQTHFETNAERGYMYIGVPGMMDWFTAFLFDWPNKPFKTGKLKNFSTNFPQGTKEQNLGGVYTDVLDFRVAGGFTIKESISLKVGVQGGFGLQSSVCNFDEQTGATFFNTPGYKKFKGFNANLIFSKNPSNLVWRNTFLYNYYSGEADNIKIPGKGFKIESVLYLTGAFSIGCYYQSTTMSGTIAEPWLYGENVYKTPKSNFTNFGILFAASIVKGH